MDYVVPGWKGLHVAQRFVPLFVPSLGEDRKKNAFPNIADWRSLVTELVFPLETSKYEAQILLFMQTQT